MLHTINKSPYEKNSLQTCLRVAPEKSKILFIEDGVYAALKNTDFEENLVKIFEALNLSGIVIIKPSIGDTFISILRARLLLRNM